MAIRTSDQISIVDLTDGYSVLLTNDSHTFLGDTSKAIAASTQTTVIAMCGASQVAASVNLDDVVKPTGVNVTKDTDATQPTLTIEVTTAVTAGGTVDIPVQLDNGNITIHKLFTFQIAFKGSPGAAGTSSQWYTGTKITGTSTTATIFSDSGITEAKVGDMYLNTSTQNTYRCTVAGAASVAKWVWANSASKTLTWSITPDTIMSQPIYASIYASLKTRLASVRTLPFRLEIEGTGSDGSFASLIYTISGVQYIDKYYNPQITLDAWRYPNDEATALAATMRVQLAEGNNASRFTAKMYYARDAKATTASTVFNMNVSRDVLFGVGYSANTSVLPGTFVNGSVYSFLLVVSDGIETAS